MNGTSGNININSTNAAPVTVSTGFASVTNIPTANASSYNTNACEFNTVALNGAASGGTGSGYVYSWTGPNSYTSTDQNAIISDSALTNMSGTYSLIVTDDNNCASLPSTISITINALPSLNLGYSEAYCYDAGNQTLSPSPSGGTWSGNGITNSSGIFNPSIAGNGVHNLTYSFTDANSCTNTAIKEITVNGLPTVNAGSDVNFQPYGTILFDATVAEQAGLDKLY